MGKKAKLNPEMYAQIRAYSQTHSIKETADHFGVSDTTITWVKRYNSFREMKTERAALQRDYYRRANNVTPPDYRIGEIASTDKPKIESPFTNNVELTPTLPPNVEKAPEQDSEPVVTQEATLWQGKNAKEWADEAKKWEEMASELDKELDKYKKLNKDSQEKMRVMQGNMLLMETEKPDVRVLPDPTCSIFVKVGDIEVSVPIPQK